MIARPLKKSISQILVLVSDLVIAGVYYFGPGAVNPEVKAGP
jgi:hypothetical protein